MTRVLVALLFAVACLAQTPAAVPEPPPSDIDAALRARVTDFIHYHVTGEFRKAEALVADDSKEFFYNHDKPRYLQFVRIERIDYTDDFTKATATVSVVSPQMIPGWEGGPPTIPIPTMWKLVNGRWFWYLPPQTMIRTPFGNIPLETMKGAASVSPGMVPGSIVPGATAPVPAPPSSTSPNKDALAGMFPAGVAPNGAPPLPGVPMTTPAVPAQTPGAPPPPDPRALAAISGARQLGMTSPSMMGSVPADQLDWIKFDKTTIVLTPGEAEKINISNNGSGLRTLLVLGSLAGVEAKMDRNDMQSGENAVLTLLANKDAKNGILTMAISQTAEMFNVQISIKK